MILFPKLNFFLVVGVSNILFFVREMATGDVNRMLGKHKLDTHPSPKPAKRCKANSISASELERFQDETTDFQDAIEDIHDQLLESLGMKNTTTATMGLREIAQVLLLGSLTAYHDEPNDHFLILDSHRQCYFVADSLGDAADCLAECMLALPQFPKEAGPDQYYLETVQGFLDQQSWKLDDYLSAQAYSEATELRLKEEQAEERKVVDVRQHPILQDCLRKPLQGYTPIPRGIVTQYAFEKQSDHENCEWLNLERDSQWFTTLEDYRNFCRNHVLQAEGVKDNPGVAAREFFVLQHMHSWMYRALFDYMEKHDSFRVALAQTGQDTLSTGDVMLDTILTTLRCLCANANANDKKEEEVKKLCNHCDQMTAEWDLCTHCKKEYCALCIKTCKECDLEFCPDMCYECKMCKQHVCQQCIPGECEWCDTFHCIDDYCENVNTFPNPPRKPLCFETFARFHECSERFMKPHENEPIGSESHKLARQLVTQKWAISWKDLPKETITPTIPCKFDIDHKLARRLPFVNSGSEAIVFRLGEDCMLKRRVCSGREWECSLRIFARKYPGMVLEEIPLSIREEKNTGDYDIFVQKLCKPVKAKKFEAQIRSQWFSTTMPSNWNEFLFWEWGLVGESLHVFDWN